MMFEVRKCINPECKLRYTIHTAAPAGLRCPHCRSETIVLLSDLAQEEVPTEIDSPARIHLEVMLDNIRSAWNVGAMFRAADGAGVASVHICGVSATPPHAGLAKTSLGAEKSVPWQYHPDAVETAKNLVQSGYRLWALEGGLRAEPLARVVKDVPSPLVLVVGNEVSGVDPGIIEVCERVVYLPMQGIKKSLNVAIAFGIAVYWLRFREAV
jgi:tRNA G18 (ribose-2'-O)-methylase SpoU